MDIQKERMKKYNKTKYDKALKNPIQCECGRYYNTFTRKRHLESAVHRKIIDMKLTRFNEFLDD